MARSSMLVWSSYARDSRLIVHERTAFLTKKRINIELSAKSAIASSVVHIRLRIDVCDVPGIGYYYYYAKQAVVDASPHTIAIDDVPVRHA